MVVSFGTIYAGILRDSGITLEKGLYIAPRPFREQMKEYGASEEMVQNLHNRVQQSGTGVISNVRHGRHLRWTYNRFNVLPHSDFYDSDNKVKDPRQIIMGAHLCSRVYDKLLPDLRGELWSLPSYTTVDDELSMDQFTKALTSFMKLGKVDLAQLPKGVRVETNRLVRRLMSQRQVGENDYEGLLIIASHVKRLTFHSAQYRTRFDKQAKAISKVDPYKTPTRWEEGKLKRWAVRRHLGTLEDRLKELKEK